MKILDIGDRMVATMAGGAADCQFWTRIVAKYCTLVYSINIDFLSFFHVLILTHFLDYTNFEKRRKLLWLLQVNISRMFCILIETMDCQL